MKRWFQWAWALNKRLYKKASFLLLLAILPLAMVSLSAMAQEESGFIHIALAQEDPADAISNEILQALDGEISLIRFSIAETPAEAAELVLRGKADGAWIFPAEMQRKIHTFSAQGSDYSPFVRVIEREDQLLIRISREKLSAALYPYCARAKYLNLTERFPETADLSAEQLMEAYETTPINETLFEFIRPDQTPHPAPEGGDYLTAPARGFLAVLMLLCGLAAAMYYLQDEERGTFARIPLGRRSGLAFCSLLTALLNLGVMVFCALWLSDLAGPLWQEAAGLFLFCLCCAEFCLILMRLLRSIRLFGALIPVWILGTLVVCPVFIDWRQLTLIQHLLPPTLFINLGRDSRYLGWLALYALAGGALCLLIENRSKGRLKK